MTGMSEDAKKQEQRPDEEERRAYWTAQLEEAYAFMDAVKDVPYEDCGEVLVSLRDAVRDAGVEVAFSEKPVGNNRERLFYMREGLIEYFAAVAREMNERGWVLKVEDGYRTVAIQTELGMQPNVFPTIVRKIIWEEGGKIPPLDKIFRRLTCLVATSPRIGTHMSGSAMDIPCCAATTARRWTAADPTWSFQNSHPWGRPSSRPRRKRTGRRSRH